MSHTVKVQTSFTLEQIDQLKSALEILGWSLATNAQCRQYAGRSTQYPWVAVNPDKSSNAYDVGIKTEAAVTDEEGYVSTPLAMETDFYGGSVGRTLGDNMASLKVEFAEQAIRDSFADQTQCVSVTMDAETGDRIVEIEIGNSTTY